MISMTICIQAEEQVRTFSIAELKAGNAFDVAVDEDCDGYVWYHTYTIHSNILSFIRLYCYLYTA